MERALIITDAPKAMKFFRDFLENYGYEKIRLAATVEDGRQAMSEFSPDVCIINAPIGHEDGESLSVELAADMSCQVILFIKEDYYNEVSGSVEKEGVMCLPKPISKSLFARALGFAEAGDSRMKKAYHEIKRLEKKIEEMRLVNRAKSILMTEKSMSEPDAHRYIEKTAMDRRVSRGQVAEEIIDFYTT